MTVYCHGNCHVWLGASSLCTCEAHRVAMYGLPQNYNPFLPHAPQPTPTLPDPQGGLPGACVPLARIEAAERAGATHLSGDGQYIFTVRYGRVLQADWDGARFGSWLDVGEEMPKDAVAMK